MSDSSALPSPEKACSEGASASSLLAPPPPDASVEDKLDYIWKMQARLTQDQPSAPEKEAEGSSAPVKEATSPSTPPCGTDGKPELLPASYSEATMA